MEPGQSNRVSRSAFGAILFVACAALILVAWTQHRSVMQLRSDKAALEERIKELGQRGENPGPSAGQQAEIERLREDNKDLLRLRDEVSRLRARTGEAGTGPGTNESRTASASEIERLREDNKDLLRLRNEVRQLREQAGETETLRAANTRFLELLQDPSSFSNLAISVGSVRKQGSLLGIEIVAPPAGSTQAYRGALVGQIMTDAPAAKSGLQSGDLIIGLDGRAIGSAAQLQVEMLTRKPGETVLLDVMRNGQVVRVPVQTRAWPE
jgi:hypothetical protein